MSRDDEQPITHDELRELERLMSDASAARNYMPKLLNELRRLRRHPRTLAHGIVVSVDESNSSSSKSDDSSDEAAITPYKARRPVRIERTRADRLDALESHIRLLRGYTQHAFEGGDSDYFGEVAAKLRLLVGEHGNKPLLLNLMDEMAQPITITLGGPPIQPLPGRPGPGDQLTLREYLHLEAMILRIPSRGLVSFTKAQLIDAWAQQVGAAHEDRAVDERARARALRWHIHRRLACGRG